MFKGELRADFISRISRRKIYSVLLLFFTLTIFVQPAIIARQLKVSNAVSPDQTFETDFFFRRVDSSDSYNLFIPENLETSSAKAKALINAPSVLLDGERKEITALVLGDRAVSYQWSYEPQGAAKTPAWVGFSSPDAAQTQVTAHWYARTKGNCAAEFSSAYLIKLKIKLQNGGELSETIPLTVEVPHNWGGFVDYPETAGVPQILFDKSRNVWAVAGMGGLKRIIKPPVLRALETSQFFRKIKAHEDVHLRQMSDGVFADLFQISSLMPKLKQLSDASRQQLEQKIFQTIQEWRKSELQIATQRLPQAEKEAYSVSDQIEPKYLFNNCQRFK